MHQTNTPEQHTTLQDCIDLLNGYDSGFVTLAELLLSMQYAMNQINTDDEALINLMDNQPYAVQFAWQRSLG